MLDFTRPSAHLELLERLRSGAPTLEDIEAARRLLRDYNFRQPDATRMTELRAALACKGISSRDD